jgi:hypothetical protein
MLAVTNYGHVSTALFEFNSALNDWVQAKKNPDNWSKVLTTWGNLQNKVATFKVDPT